MDPCEISLIHKWMCPFIDLPRIGEHEDEETACKYVIAEDE